MKKGLNLDECFRHVDFEGRGVVERDQFVGVLKRLGLPIQTKHILVLADRYSMPPLTLQVDYESFIHDTMSELASVDGEDSLGSGGAGRGAGNHSPYRQAITDLRRMLLDSKIRLNKSDDDIYRMFSRWDSGGRGLVTITQFFRVLEQLHVVLADSTQDIVAEILDTDGKGKVDFDSFLAYCSSEDDSSALGAGGATDRTDESLLSGGGSTGGGTAISELRSTGRTQRPHTASAFRGATADRGGHGDEGESSTSHHDHTLGDPTELSPSKSVQPRRPLTASGRVLNGEYRARTRDHAGDPSTSKRSNDSGNLFILDIASDEEREEALLPDEGTSHAHTLELVSPESGNWDKYSGHYSGPSVRPSYHLTSTPVSDGNVSALGDDDMYMGEGRREAGRGYRQSPHHGHTTALQQEGPSSQHRSGVTRAADRTGINMSPGNEKELEWRRRGGDGTGRPYGSGYHDEVGDSYQMYRRPNEGKPNTSATPQPFVHTYPPPKQQQQQQQQQLQQQTPQQQATYANGRVPVDTPPPMITPQALENARAALRQAIVAHHSQYGSTLRDIFTLIDMNGVRYFNARDLMVAAKSHFNLTFGPQTSAGLIRIIALDGQDRVSFAEFVVFVNDPQFRDLQEKLQTQVCTQLEQQGREYQYLLFSVLSHEASGDGDEEDASAAPASGLVSCASFGQSLLKLGLVLDKEEVDRIVTRFDTHGTGQCSVSRFMNVVQQCERWKFTLDTLAFHEEAIEECQVVRHRMRSNARHAIKNTFDEETLEMAEYLGIRILSEPHLLWIVDKAVRAPLPEGWSVHNDRDGRTFFFHAEAGITRWDHPSDPYFRQLRDDWRKK